MLQCLARWEGDKLVMALDPKVPGRVKSQTHTRELNGDELIVVIVVDIP